MLISINGTFIVAMVSFIIFLLVMKYLLFHPMSKVIVERQDFYDKNSKDVLENKEKASKLIVQKDQELAKTRLEATSNTKDVLEKTQNEQDELLKQAKVQSVQELETLRNELNEKSNSIKSELRNEIETFISTIATNVLEKEVKVHLDEQKLSTILNYKGE